jgi:hypothetical protein
VTCSSPWALRVGSMRDATEVALDKSDKGGVAVGLATISVVLAALVFAAEKTHTGPMQFIERHLGFSPGGDDGSM